MRFLADMVVLFWLTVGVIIWLVFNYHTSNPLSYGIMEIVMLGLVAAWIDTIAELRRIYREEMD